MVFKYQNMKEAQLLDQEFADKNNANDELTADQWKLFEEVTDTVAEINNSLANHDIQHPNEAEILACHLLSRAMSSDSLGDATYERVADGMLDSDESVTCMFKDELTPESWDAVRQIASEHDPWILRMTTHLRASGDKIDDTPREVTSLVLRLMHIEDGMSVADIGCGRGRFLQDAHQENASCEYVGYEIETYATAAARIVSKLDDDNNPSFEVVQTNAFTLVFDEGHPTYDRVFSNYPIAAGIGTAGARQFAEHMCDKYPWLRNNGMADWAYNALALEMMAPGGKAIAIMSKGSATNAAHEDARQYFIEHGLVECAITLPERLLPGTRIATSLVVFSEGNDRVRLVDATPYCVEGRRHWSISDTGIEDIVRASLEDGEHSRSVTLDDLRNESYTLDLGRYVDTGTSTSNMKPLGELLSMGKGIVRGTTATAKKLDDALFRGVSNLRYLTPANIDDGLVDYSSLVSISDLTQTIAWSLISEPRLVIPRNGDPSKVAVVEPPDGQLIFPSGNMYIVKVDPFLIDPYYLAAYLKSEEGAAELAKRTVGTTTRSISIKELKTLPIPVRPVDEQEAIAKRYRYLVDELATLAMRVAGTKSKIANAFSREGVC